LLQSIIHTYIPNLRIQIYQKQKKKNRTEHTHA
jgi:hypothetical protein